MRFFVYTPSIVLVVCVLSPVCCLGYEMGVSRVFFYREMSLSVAESPEKSQIVVRMRVV